MRLVVLAVGLALCAAVGARAAEVYVARGGSDRNPGTLAKPFATLERARDAVRALKASGMPAGGATVWIRGGEYRLTDTFQLGRDDSIFGTTL